MPAKLPVTSGRIVSKNPGGGNGKREAARATGHAPRTTWPLVRGSWNAFSQTSIIFAGSKPLKLGTALAEE